MEKIEKVKEEIRIVNDRIAEDKSVLFSIDSKRPMYENIKNNKNTAKRYLKNLLAFVAAAVLLREAMISWQGVFVIMKYGAEVSNIASLVIGGAIVFGFDRHKYSKIEKQYGKDNIYENTSYVDAKGKLIDFEATEKRIALELDKCKIQKEILEKALAKLLEPEKPLVELEEEKFSKKQIYEAIRKEIIDNYEVKDIHYKEFYNEPSEINLNVKRKIKKRGNEYGKNKY